VETDETPNQKTVLTLKAEIPQQLEVSPNFVFWKQGDKPDAKTINVKVGKDFTVKHIKVTSSTPDFQAKVEEAGNGQFKIEVKPQDTNKVSASMLTIQPEDSQKVFLRHCADYQRPDGSSCSNGSSRCNCAGSSDCSDWSNALKFLLVRQAAVIAALALLPAAGEAIYFRDKISWRSAIAPSEMVTVEHARGWSDTAIWVDARRTKSSRAITFPGAISLNEDRWNELLPAISDRLVARQKSQCLLQQPELQRQQGSCTPLAARKRSFPTYSCSKAAGKRGQERTDEGNANANLPQSSHADAGGRPRPACAT
jgi:hypothetical protein